MADQLPADIVERLRRAAERAGREWGYFPLVKEAADEIEGLRLEHQNACLEIGVAIAERDQLRVVAQGSVETDWFDECSKQAGKAFHYWSVLDRIKDRLGGPADAQMYDIRQLVEAALASQPSPAATVEPFDVMATIDPDHAESFERHNGSSAATGGKPVAWRIKDFGDENWLLCYDLPTAKWDCIEPLYTHASPKDLLDRLNSRISTRLNDVLCEMKPDYDDSIVGFNEAWDIVRAVFKDELARAHTTIPVEPQPTRETIALGDMAYMNERSPYFHDWKGVSLKVVSLRIEPDGKLWASVIEGEQRHRGNGVYDAETTDIDAEHLSPLSRPKPSTGR